MSRLTIKTPRWALPLLKPARYKGAKGGRSSGKSHFFAERVIEEMVADQDVNIVCIREIQKDLRYSAKKLVEDKIRKLNLFDFFEINQNEIRRRGGYGTAIFQGMQDHTSDSIKSLEGFKFAWVEEAQNLSERSLKLLRPTFRVDDSEMWFSWNPEAATDAVEKFFHQNADNPECVLVHVNYDQNPFFPETMRKEMENDKKRYPEDFDHVWLGAFNLRSDQRVFKHWRVEEFEAPQNAVFYYGADWGFSQDPTVLLRAYIDENNRSIFVDYQIDGVGIEIDQTPRFFAQIPDATKHVIRADNARPETISYMNRSGFNVAPAQKGMGSVEDGIAWLKSYDIIIHPRCRLLEKELRLYSYAANKAGDILPKLEDANNHCIDALRYAFEPIIKKQKNGGFVLI